MKQLELKLKGQYLSAIANHESVMRAREIAKEIGIENGFCSIEDVRKHWYSPAPFGNWAGSIFKEKCWKFDSYIRATHEGSHSRPVVLWRYIGNKNFFSGSFESNQPSRNKSCSVILGRIPSEIVEG